jgi:hypothetical protein
MRLFIFISCIPLLNLGSYFWSDLGKVDSKTLNLAHQSHLWLAFVSDEVQLITHLYPSLLCLSLSLPLQMYPELCPQSTTLGLRI